MTESQSTMPSLAVLIQLLPAIAAIFIAISANNIAKSANEIAESAQESAREIAKASTRPLMIVEMDSEKNLYLKNVGLGPAFLHDGLIVNYNAQDIAIHDLKSAGALALLFKHPPTKVTWISPNVPIGPGQQRVIVRGMHIDDAQHFSVVTPYSDGIGNYYDENGLPATHK